MFLKFFIRIFIVTILSSVKINSYNTGLIFYDPVNRIPVLPPIISPLHSSNSLSLRMPMIGFPCSCQNSICGCCAGIKMDQFNIDQKLCANVSYTEEDLALNMFVLLNEQNILKETFSARNPPPLCMPLMLPLPLAMCLRFTNMRFDHYNVHFCMDWIVRFNMSNDLFQMHFNCIKLGQHGFQYIDSMGNPVFPMDGNGFEKISKLLSKNGEVPTNIEISKG